MTWPYNIKNDNDLYKQCQGNRGFTLKYFLGSATKKNDSIKVKNRQNLEIRFVKKKKIK